LVAQLAVKIGCTAPEKETLALPHVQTPEEHVCPGEQTLPHLPQLLVSLAVSTHELPHRVPPFEQAQAPFWQVCAVGQTCPQAPQLATSVWRFAQAVPQTVKPVPH
jgi:hypothetical protein